MFNTTMNIEIIYTIRISPKSISPFMRDAIDIDSGKTKEFPSIKQAYIWACVNIREGYWYINKTVRPIRKAA